MTRSEFVGLEIGFLALTLLLIIAGCAGFPLPSVCFTYVVVYIQLLIGWVFYLERVVPQVSLDWLGITLAVLSLLGLVGGLHWFCTWLHRELISRRLQDATEPTPATQAIPKWRLRITLSIVGVVVLMFIAGTAAVGTVHQLIWLRTRS